MRHINNQVLIRYPELWLTRFQYIIPAAALLLLAGIVFGLRIPLAIDRQDFLFTSLFLFCIPGFFWVRFQFFHYQPFYIPRRILRLFFLNTAGCFLFLAIPTFIYMSAGFRIAHLRATRDLSGDFSVMKMSAYYADSIFCDRLEKTAATDRSSLPIRLSRLNRDSIRLAAHSPGDKWPGPGTVMPMATRLAALYGLDMFHGEYFATAPNDYLAYLDEIAARWNAVPDTLTQFYRYSMMLLCTATMMSLLMLHVIAGQGLQLLASGFLSLALWMLLGIGLVDFLLPNGVWLNVAICFGALLIFLVVVFNRRKRVVQSREKTFAILALPYSLFTFWMMISDMVYYVVIHPATGGHDWTWFGTIATAYGVGVLFLGYYIPWYWRYAFRPQWKG